MLDFNQIITDAANQIAVPALFVFIVFLVWIFAASGLLHKRGL